MKKETKAKIKKAVLGLVLAVPMFVSACHATQPQATSDHFTETFDSENYVEIDLGYSSQEEKEQIADYLECDTYAINIKNRDTFEVLIHNDNEPIYVVFDEKMDDSYKQITKEVLDYVFKIVNKINDNYTYKIIDNNEQIYGFSTAIKYGVDNEMLNHGVCYQSFYEDGYSFGASIYLNTNCLKTEKEEDIINTYYTILHETAHAFGFDDTYFSGANRKTDNVYANTIMCLPRYTKSNPNEFAVKHFSPNDLRCLIALYAKKGTIQNKDELEKLKVMADKYEQEYYKKYIENEKCKEPIEEAFSIELNSTNPEIYSHQIEVKDGKYTIKIIDSTGEILETVTGEAMLIEKEDGTSATILKDVYSKLMYKDRIDEDINEFVCDLFVKKHSKNVYSVQSCIGRYYQSYMTPISVEKTEETSLIK